jgi:hypothetical protein
MRRVVSRNHKEVLHAATSNSRYPPPRRVRVRRPSSPRQLWAALAAVNREQILKALSRVVAEHLALPPIQQEVTHEQS